MSEVYKKVGRGGAGNYYSKQDIADATKNTSDIESQLPSQTTPTSSSSHMHTQTPSAPEYQHTGRGGAGNWIQPSTLKLTTPDGLNHRLTQQPPDAHSTETTRPAEAPPQRVMGSSKPMYRGGRGGAGNYYSGEEEKEEERMKREREIEEGIGRGVLEDVERGLRRPERAYGDGVRERE